MPSRYLSAGIVLFWIGTLAWFGYRDLWPYWATSEAPPFVIDLADEARLDNEVLWQIYRAPSRGGPSEEIGLARTYLRFRNQEDAFELTSEWVDVKLMDNVRVPKMINRYEVTRAGELRSASAEGELRVMMVSVEGKATATVRDGRLVRTAKLKFPIIGTIEPKLDDAEAPRGSVLNPLHPVSRIKGLTPGRRWKMPIIDPLSDMLKPTIAGAAKDFQPKDQPLSVPLPEGPKTLSAEVLHDRAKILYDGVEHDCHVVEYRGKDQEVLARTFVRISDDLVLRQEATTMSESFYLQRMSALDKVRTKSFQYFKPKPKSKS